MTRISYLSGVPVNEFVDRGRMAPRPGYIPYLSMTEGEMKLELMRQQAKTLAAFYPDFPQYKAAERMVDAALKAGVHQGIKWIGRVDDSLQHVARQIAQAEAETRPAAGHLYGRPSLMNGIGAVIPVMERYQKCLQDARNIAERTKCQTRFEIEKILNNGLEPSAHHIIYLKLRKDYNYPVNAAIKRSDHSKGVAGLAVVGEIGEGLMTSWVDTTILQKNTTGGVGAIYSEQASFLLSPDPDADWAAYKAGQPFTSLEEKKRKLGIGNPFARIGDPATIIALATLITAALGGAVKLLEQMRQQKAYAMAEARGFGTSEFSANKSDWLGPGGMDKNTLLLLAAGAGALLLMNDDD